MVTMVLARAMTPDLRLEAWFFVDDALGSSSVHEQTAVNAEPW